jgi:hypothetical protein
MGSVEQPIKLDTGALTPAQLDALLGYLPLEVTFVDENDIIRYFSVPEKRIFPREAAIIGKRVQECHKPSSVPAVNRIIDDFRAGRKDMAESWHSHEGRTVHVRYLAVRNRDGKYLGCLETAQDVTDIRESKAGGR